MRLFAWGQTDVGSKRDHNEDAFLVALDLGLFVVADGMGGHLGGDRASRLAVAVLKREIGAALQNGLARPAGASVTAGAMPATAAAANAGGARVAAGAAVATVRAGRPGRSGDASPAAAALRDATRSASHAIYDLAQADAQLQGMGTTLTALFVHRERAYLGHVGDSRAYLYRDGKVSQLTEDHSWIYEQVKAGLLTPEDARDSRFKHIITRSVGFERDVVVDLQQLPVSSGDCFLLCSDGLSNHVEPAELASVLVSNYYRNVPQILIELANQRGGDDNISVIVVYAANDA